jgi:fumarate reductase flavoprotein subunit
MARARRLSADTGLPKAEVVVIGAGGAGLMAAQAALESGARDVVVLEKAAAPGGNTSQSAGMFAVGSPAQRRKGIEVSAEEVFREKMAYANWRVDPGLVRDCIGLSGPIVERFESLGMCFDNVIEFVREGTAPRLFHSFSPGPQGFIGRRVVAALADECEREGARILCGIAVTGIRTGEGGKIAAVEAHSGDRNVHVGTRSVILATGGFGANKGLLEKYFPGHGDVFTQNFPEMTGDGLLMAEGLGAIIDDNRVLLVTGPHHYPWSHVLSLLVRRPDILLVNKQGERYCAETIFLDNHTEAGNALSRQPEMICYALLDSSMLDRIVMSGQVIGGMEREAGGNGAWLRELGGELEAGVTRGTVFRSSEWEDIARWMGADPNVLSVTIRRYNDHCHRGHDDEFCKEEGFLLPLRTPPFYAVLGRQGFDTTLGGIKVSRGMEVVGRQGGPIPGLYAAGDCASGWEHSDYNLRHPGSAMTFALCSGHIAGRRAAEYVADGAHPAGRSSG